MKTNYPSVSIIVPNFNRRDTILLTIKAILAQKYGDFELIIIDESTDDSKELISTIRDPRILLLHDTKRHGYAYARNRGLSIARGKIIAYCDSDDILYPTYLSEVVKIFNSQPQIGFVICKYYITVDGINEYFKSYPKKCLSKNDINLSPILEVPCCGMPFMSHRKRCLERIGGFSTNKNAYLGEDWDLFMRMSDLYKFYTIDKFLGERRYHGTNISLLSKNILLRQHVYKYFIIKKLKGFETEKDLKDYALASSFLIAYYMLHYKFNNAWHSIKRRLLDFDDGRLKDILKLGCKGIECAFEREATKAIANITQCIDMIKTLPKKEGVGGQEALHLAKAHALMLEGKRINYAILQRHPDIKNNMFAKKEFIWVLTAQREYKKALRLSDGICCPRIFNCRGICFYMLGQKRLAVKEFKKSLLLSPAYTPARNNLRLIKKTQ